MKILAISPTFNNTKIALFENNGRLWCETQHYDLALLEEFPNILSQEDFRVGQIRQLLAERNADLSEINVFAATGGMLHPVEGGTYQVNIKMLQDLISCRYGERAINLGALLAARMARLVGSRYVYIVDPPVVDEMSEAAHITGLPDIKRKSIFHALNHKAVAHKQAAAMEKPLNECNFVVCYLGDVISVGAHRKGKVIEVNDIFGGSGPMSLDRAGDLPSISLIDLCFSGKYTVDELKTRIMGVGGFVAHLGTNDTDEIVKRVRSGDRKARLIFEAFLRSLSMSIGGCAAVLKGNVDAVILAGPMMGNDYLCEQISELVEWIAPTARYPEEDDMQSLADGVMRVMKGQDVARIYS